MNKLLLFVFLVLLGIPSTSIGGTTLWTPAKAVKFCEDIGGVMVPYVEVQSRKFVVCELSTSDRSKYKRILLSFEDNRDGTYSRDNSRITGALRKGGFESITSDQLYNMMSNGEID